jgi:hypothetical protein
MGLNNFNNLRSGAPGTRNGTITSGVNGTVGPVVITADSSVNNITFTGNPAVQDLVQTVAMICIPTTVGSFCVTSSDGTNGVGIGNFGASNWGYSTSAGSFNDTGISMTLNVPTFVAISINASVANFVVCNLATGKIQTAILGGITQAGAGNGTYFLLGDNNGDVGAVQIAAFMFSAGSLLSLNDSTYWASDPWSFWYPKTFVEQPLVGQSFVAPAATPNILGIASSEW